jgi:cytochrome c551/c552
VKVASGDVAAAWAGHEEVLLRLDAWRKQPGGAPWGQLETLVRELNGHPAVADAKLVRIDWVAEADLIKANSPK